MEKKDLEQLFELLSKLQPIDHLKVFNEIRIFTKERLEKDSANYAALTKEIEIYLKEKMP